MPARTSRALGELSFTLAIGTSSSSSAPALLCPSAEAEALLPTFFVLPKAEVTAASLAAVSRLMRWGVVHGEHSFPSTSMEERLEEKLEARRAMRVGEGAPTGRCMDPLRTRAIPEKLLARSPWPRRGGVAGPSSASSSGCRIGSGSCSLMRLGMACSPPCLPVKLLRAKEERLRGSSHSSLPSRANDCCSKVTASAMASCSSAAPALAAMSSALARLRR
mmetsp:Transcript_11775/g.24704  ORF Transcript_11775/g.24704 Transcript_11775/m.24704 type:complete len:220 (-) Transcript_11775:2283-2942(-)